jgi:phosphotransferase system IIB component
MKNRLLLIILISFWYQSLAQISADEQKNIEQKLMRNWMKYRVEMKDGSQVPDDNIAKNAASMLIFKKGNICIIISGKTANQSQYAVSSSVLMLGGITSYVIEKLTEYELILHGSNEDTPDNEIIRYHYVSTPESPGQYFFRQFIKPNISVQADGDTAYNFNEYIFPKYKLTLGDFPAILSDFYQVYESSYDMIESDFNFPDKKKGNFSVIFAVSKFGILKDVEVKESSDSTYNNALVQAVSKTIKRWLPAEYENKKVETRFNYVFIYNGEDKKEDDFDAFEYETIKNKANRQFEKKEYVKAIKLYTKCILMQDQDFDFEPYYKRANSYFVLKVNKNACLDWSYLSKKGQKKAEKLFFDNCMN